MGVPEGMKTETLLEGKADKTTVPLESEED